MAVEENFSYSFVSSTEPCDDYICPITGKVMLDPCKTGCCGKHLSRAKAEKLTNGNRSCPMCNAPSPAQSAAGRLKIFTASPDSEFQEKILQLQVRCFYSEDGCGWEGPLQDFQSHTFSCNMQAWKCQYCVFRSTQLVGTTEHAQICENRPIQCSCNDASPIPFHEYEAHLVTCPAQPIPCELADIGCQEEFPRSESAQHMKECVSQHQLLVSQQNLKILTAMNTRLEVHKDKEGVPKLKEDLAASETEVESLRGVVGTFKEKLKATEESVRKLKEQVKQSQSEKEEVLVAMEKRYKVLFSMLEEQAKQGESVKKVEIASMEKKHEELMEEKEAEMERLQQEARQLQRLHVSNEEEADIEQLVHRESNASANLAIETILEITDNLRSNHQNGLSGTDVMAIVKKLDDFLSTALSTDFLDNSDSGASDSSATSSPPFSRGKLERVILEDLKKPWGVAVFGSKVYVVDTNGTFGLHVTTPRDESTSTETMIASATISEVTLPVGKCWYPRGVTVDKDANIILVDTGTHRILKFSPLGKLLHMAGTESTLGNTSGEFNGPVGVGISPEGKVFVCDCFNHRVQVLGTELQFLEEFGEMGDGPKKFLRPWDVAFDKQGNVYVADCGNRCVKVFTAGLEPLKVIGQGKGKTYKKGDLRAPSSLCIDRNDFLYVADKSLGSVFVYDNQGNMKCRFGQLTEPRGVAVDEDGRVYVTDMGGWSYFKPFKASGRVQMYS